MRDFGKLEDRTANGNSASIDLIYASLRKEQDFCKLEERTAILDFIYESLETKRAMELCKTGFDYCKLKNRADKGFMQGGF